MGVKANANFLAQEVARGLNAAPVLRLVDLGSQLEAVISARTEPVHPTFELSVISRLDWLQFELLVQRLFEARGLWVERTPIGAHSGLDMRLFGEGRKPVGIVECTRKQSTGFLSAETVRAFSRVVVREGAAKGHLVTSGSVHHRALREVSSTVTVTTGAEVIALIKQLTPSAQASLKNEVFARQWWIPSCPTCGRKKLVVLNGTTRCIDEPCTNAQSLLVQTAG